MEDAMEDSEWDSGPYCRHWRDPSECDELCNNCHHECRNHTDKCGEPGCECLEWEAL